MDRDNARICDERTPIEPGGDNRKAGEEVHMHVDLEDARRAIRLEGRNQQGHQPCQGHAGDRAGRRACRIADCKQGRDTGNNRNADQRGHKRDRLSPCSGACDQGGIEPQEANESSAEAETDRIQAGKHRVLLCKIRDGT